MPPPSSEGGRRLEVAAGLLRDGELVLVCQRSAAAAHPLRWEFPGGKLEADESAETCLVRELREELGIETATSCLAPIAFASHGYERFHLLMPVFACRKWLGAPQSREGQALRWVMPIELSRYPMPPADVPLVGLLRDLL